MDKKNVWSTSDIIKNRNNWSLAADAELLTHLQFLSENIFNKANDTIQKLNSFESEINQTCIAFANTSNSFKSLSDKQFIESKIQDEGLDVLEPSPSSSGLADKNSVQNEHITVKLKTALENGFKVLDTRYDIIKVTDSDSEDEEPQEILKSRNPYLSRRLPYIIGTEEFTEKDHLGLVDTSSEDDDTDYEEEDDEEAEEESESEKVEIPRTKVPKTEFSRPLTQVIRISSSDSEDSEISISSSRSSARKDGGMSKESAVDAKLPSKPTQSTYGFAEHLNATLQSNRKNVDSYNPSVPPDFEDIFSPPPFPSKDNDESSDEERSDSSGDIFSFKKPVVNVSSKGKDEPNNDENDSEYDKSQNPRQQNEIATSSINREPPSMQKNAEKPSQKSSASSKISHNSSESSLSSLASSNENTATKQQANETVATKPSSISDKNLSAVNKKVATAISAELNAKLKSKSSPTIKPEKETSSQQPVTQEKTSASKNTPNSLGGHTVKKKETLFGDVDSEKKSEDLFGSLSSQSLSAKPLKNKNKTLSLFDNNDETDDEVDDLFKPLSTKPVATETSNNLEANSIGAKANPAAETVPISSKTQSSLFASDSDSEDDIFSIINSQKKVSADGASDKEKNNTAQKRNEIDDLSKKETVAPSNVHESEVSVSSSIISNVEVKNQGNLSEQKGKNENNVLSDSTAAAKKSNLFNEKDEDMFKSSSSVAQSNDNDLFKSVKENSSNAASKIESPFSTISKDNKKKQNLFNSDSEEDDDLFGTSSTTKKVINDDKNTRSFLEDKQVSQAGHVKKLLSEKDGSELKIEKDIPASDTRTESAKNTATEDDIFVFRPTPPEMNNDNLSESEEELIKASQSIATDSENDLFEVNEEAPTMVAKCSNSESKEPNESAVPKSTNEEITKGNETDNEVDDLFATKQKDSSKDELFSFSRPDSRNKVKLSENPSDTFVNTLKDKLDKLYAANNKQLVSSDADVSAPANETRIFTEERRVADTGKSNPKIDVKPLPVSAANSIKSKIQGFNKNSKSESNTVSEITNVSTTPVKIKDKINVFDEQDGNVVGKKVEIVETEPVTKPKPGKLAMSRGLNINVNALLPGSNWSSKIKQQQNTTVEEVISTDQPNVISENPVTIESEAPTSGLLNSVVKERAKISAARRPPTRRGRKTQLSKRDMFSDVDGVAQTGTSDSPSEKKVDENIQKNFSEPKSHPTVANAVKTDLSDNVDVEDLFKSITPKVRNIPSGITEKPLVKGEVSIRNENLNISASHKQTIVKIDDPDKTKTVSTANVTENIENAFAEDNFFSKDSKTSNDLFFEQNISIKDSGVKPSKFIDELSATVNKRSPTSTDKEGNSLMAEKSVNVIPSTNVTKEKEVIFAEDNLFSEDSKTSDDLFFEQNISIKNPVPKPREFIDERSTTIKKPSPVEKSFIAEKSVNVTPSKEPLEKTKELQESTLSKSEPTKKFVSSTKLEVPLQENQTLQKSTDLCTQKKVAANFGGLFGDTEDDDELLTTLKKDPSIAEETVGKPAVDTISFEEPLKKKMSQQSTPSKGVVAKLEITEKSASTTKSEANLQKNTTPISTDLFTQKKAAADFGSLFGNNEDDDDLFKNLSHEPSPKIEIFPHVEEDNSQQKKALNAKKSGSEKQIQGKTQVANSTKIKKEVSKSIFEDDDEEELFASSAKKLPINKPTTKHLLFNESEDNDLFGTKSSSAASTNEKSTDSSLVKNAKSVSFTSKPRINKLRCETVKKDPLSGEDFTL